MDRRPPPPRLLLNRFVARDEEDLPEHKIEYAYGDTDSFQQEIEELFSYAENDELEDVVAQGVTVKKHWTGSHAQQRGFVALLLDALESCSAEKRRTASLSLLYILLALDLEDEASQLAQIPHNAALLIATGAWPVLVQAFRAASADLRDPTMEASKEARLFANLLYLMLEGARNHPHQADPIIASFVKELGESSDSQPLFATVLFELVTDFKEGKPGVPIKKVVLLLWKTLLVSCGGFAAIAARKQTLRLAAGLPPVFAPTSAIPAAAALARPQPKASSSDLDRFKDHVAGKFYGWRDPATGTIGPPPSVKEALSVLQDHLYVPLAEAQLQHESKLLQSHMPGTGHPPPHTRDGPVETLYADLLDHLEKYLIHLLRVLLAAAPVTAAPTPPRRDEPVLFTSELRAKDASGPLLAVAAANQDETRHREIIVKAIAATLLLFLKHLRVNHILQQLHFAAILSEVRCASLAVKLLNRDPVPFATEQASVPNSEVFCVLRRLRGLQEPSSPPPPSPVCARNMHAIISLLRIIQKLIKGRKSRVLALVADKSSPVLRRLLQLAHPLVQLYGLKILKLQAPFLGRGWRKMNMKILSKVDRLVRHRFHDSWFYEGHSETMQQQHFQEEDDALAHAITFFNLVYYGPQTVSVPSKDIFAALWEEVGIRVPDRFQIVWHRPAGQHSAAAARETEA